MKTRGFTLLEVLLATAVMATGVLTVVILYSMGFRETRQSNEDIVTASYADAVLSPMVSALSQTNISWSAFNNISDTPGDGWAEYYNQSDWTIKSDSQCATLANEAITAVKGVGAKGINWPSVGTGGSEINGNLKATGIVVRHEKNSPVVKIGFRAARTSRWLMAAPMYYTEVHFQGDPEK